MLDATIWAFFFFILEPIKLLRYISSVLKRVFISGNIFLTKILKLQSSVLIERDKFIFAHYIRLFITISKKIYIQMISLIFLIAAQNLYFTQSLLRISMSFLKPMLFAIFQELLIDRLLSYIQEPPFAFEVSHFPTQFIKFFWPIFRLLIKNPDSAFSVST